MPQRPPLWPTIPVLAGLLACGSCDSRALGPRGAAAGAGADAATAVDGAGAPDAGHDLGDAGHPLPTPTPCSGATGSGCGASEFCSVPCVIPPNARLAPVCEQVPTSCGKELAPVCGCDGNVYDNDCSRRAAGVALMQAGSCPIAGSSCGGFAGATCGKSQLCEYPAGTCGRADLTGQCVPVPLACDLLFRPVCGCDGNSYGNDCARQAAGVSKLSDGPCPTGTP